MKTIAILIALSANQSPARLIATAEKAAKESRWLEAVSLADELLGMRDDCFTGPPVDFERGIKRRAFLVIASAPRKLYEEQFGGMARRLLTDAVQARDAEAVQGVARRYLFTVAGYEAAILSALWSADCGTGGAWLDYLRMDPERFAEYEPGLSMACAPHFEVRSRVTCEIRWSYPGMKLYAWKDGEQLWSVESDATFVAAKCYGGVVYAIVNTGAYVELWGVSESGRLLFSHVLANDTPEYGGEFEIEPANGVILCVLPDSIVAYDPAANWLQWRFQ